MLTFESERLGDFKYVLIGKPSLMDGQRADIEDLAIKLSATTIKPYLELDKRVLKTKTVQIWLIFFFSIEIQPYSFISFNSQLYCVYFILGHMQTSTLHEYIKKFHMNLVYLFINFDFLLDNFFFHMNLAYFYGGGRGGKREDF